MTTETQVAVRQTEPTLTPFEVIERVITQGDLAKMSAGDRVSFYWRTCESLGLNPLTRPFEFINLNGKLTMYARKDATDQLRQLNGVSVTAITRDKDDDLGLLTVVATGVDKNGRADQATGVVAIKGLSGEALANAVMKAETKAKRRLTLSLVGLGFLDESEIEGATADVDPTTGELVERPQPKSLLESVRAEQEKLATSTDAPGAAEDPAPVSASTPDENGQPAAADETTGDFREVPAGLTKQQLVEGLNDAGISVAFATERGREMFPAEARANGKDLDDAQRAALLADVTAGAL